jgi:cysteine desulfurase
VSHVLKAMGLADERIHGAVRFSLGRPNTADEIDYVADRVVAEVRRLRRASPGWALRGS